MDWPSNSSASQPADIVNIVPLRQNMHGQMQFGGTFQRLVRHVLRAPGNVLEQTMMWRLHAEQVVAAS